MAGAKKKLPLYKYIVEAGEAFELKPGNKYLLIVQEAQELSAISRALSAFFEDTPVFILAVKDVTQVKLAELVKE